MARVHAEFAAKLVNVFTVRRLHVDHVREEFVVSVHNRTAPLMEYLHVMYAN